MIPFQQVDDEFHHRYQHSTDEHPLIQENETLDVS